MQSNGQSHIAMIQIPIESMNLMMLNVGLSTHHADWNWQKVSSPFIRIFYVVEGEAMLHLPEEDVRLKPNHMYIIPAYTTHSYECHGLFKLYYLHTYEGFKNEMNLQETYELPTEVSAGNGVEQLFEYILFNECTILSVEDGNVVERRPDRVMTNGQEWVVVDFKFGSPKDEYHNQVREYMQLLVNMGHTNIKGYLWFVYSNKIEEVILNQL